MDKESGEPFAGVRRVIAGKMLESLLSSAQLSYHTTLCAENLVAARKGWLARGAEVGIEDLILSCIVEALGHFPQFNGTVRGDRIFRRDVIDACVAIDLPTGLVAPALWDIGSKSVPEIAAARRELLDRARAGKLSVKEMTGGTITVSNLGLTRVEHFTPILNAGQIAIVGLGRIAAKAWVDDDGSLVAKRAMGLSLTTDHRVVDGGDSGAFLSKIADLIERAGEPS
ncbi:2-oxo acid dehydrogenase subunit E2 [Parasphingopyxis marina]|uniref:2-oxo acid dehydrogenase subunit E2 n=1 Tax=Parasphingopyxis marina TaxID=2761622 RepID=A0A842HW24_9SPHN|nr:2-oxo acid dehydrogenase subunit E2 [Parasphingopyxis marina]MBC2776627.1 2-oxo acid dehydrogenase subunit E2 [Parasphingopyxis marina]